MSLYNEKKAEPIQVFFASIPLILMFLFGTFYLMRHSQFFGALAYAGFIVLGLFGVILAVRFKSKVRSHIAEKDEKNERVKTFKDIKAQHNRALQEAKALARKGEIE